MVSTTLVPSVAAATAPLPLLRMAPEDAAASVLDLDAKDTKAGILLTAALRKAFANRGLSGGEELSLEEMRLTMGCDNDAVACLAEGGKTLGVRRLIFGYLASTDGGYQLDIQILDVDTATLESQASMPLTKADLKARTIDDTAVRIVNKLMPKAEDPDPPGPKETPDAPPDGVGDETGEDPPPDDTPKEGGIYFGLEKPTPRWKWAGFGTTLGLTVLAGGATAGMAIWLTSDNLGFRKQLLDAAADSLADDRPLNDVDPNLPVGVNLCDYARSRPTDPTTGEELGEEGEVRNATIVKLCDDGNVVRRLQLVAGVSTAVFGVATLAFTGLLLIHKRKPTADAMLRHGVRLGVAPNPYGGVSLAGGLRF